MIFLNLLDFDCFYLKIIFMPKWPILRQLAFGPYNLMVEDLELTGDDNLLSCLLGNGYFLLALNSQ